MTLELYGGTLEVYSHCECQSFPLDGSSANCLYLHSVDLMEKVHMRSLPSTHSELMIFGPLVGRWRTYWKNNNCFVWRVCVWVCGCVWMDRWQFALLSCHLLNRVDEWAEGFLCEGACVSV